MSETKSRGLAASAGKIDIYEVWDELRQTVKNQRLTKATDEAKQKANLKKSQKPAQDAEILTLSARERNIEDEIRALDTRLRNSRYKLALAEAKFSKNPHPNAQNRTKPNIRANEPANKCDDPKIQAKKTEKLESISNSDLKQTLAARQHSKLFWHETRCPSRDHQFAKKPSGDWSKTVSITADFDASFTKNSKQVNHNKRSTRYVTKKGNLPSLDPKTEEDYVQRIVTREFGNLSVFDLYAMAERPELWTRYKETVLRNQSVYSAQDGDPSELEIEQGENFDEVAKIQTNSELQSFHDDHEDKLVHEIGQPPLSSASSNKNKKIYY